MSVGERDPYTGHMTTGHEWNGIKELNTPVPKPVYVFLTLAVIIAVILWILLPAWPTGLTYTRGILGLDPHKSVAEALESNAQIRSGWISRIRAGTFDQILADPHLMQDVEKTGKTLFATNCAACHGQNAEGGKGFPRLTGPTFIWGGSPETMAETIRVGINSAHKDSRSSQMPAFGQDGLLKRADIDKVILYVRSLTNPVLAQSVPAADIAAGHEVFIANCAACHGEDAKGNPDMGSRNLTDGAWLYGGDPATLFQTIFYGRQGHMPTWEGRLTPVQIKILTAYLVELRTKAP